MTYKNSLRNADELVKQINRKKPHNYIKVLYLLIHLKKVIKHGGIAFFIIQFESLDKVFILDASYVIHFYEHGERKSIPYSCFLESGVEVVRSYNPRLKYIDAIDKLYF